MLGYGHGLRRDLPQPTLALTSLEASCSDSDKIRDNGVRIQSSGLTAKTCALGPTASSDDTTSTSSQEGDKSKEGHLKDLVKTEPEKTSSLLTSSKTTQGTKGTPIELVCNYIRINSDPNKGIYVFEVRFVPNIDSKRLRRQYLNEHSVKFGGTKTFDGVILYLPILLNDELTTIMKTLNYVRFDRRQFDPASSIVLLQHQLEYRHRQKSLWSVKIPFHQKVMICGIDLYHEAARKENSVAAFVASLNEK
uniref:Piwi domain-containing protein n=1 Tax=Glossina austeni TaxID=7395 RepID=A0A1A9VUH5_GLOAU